MTLNEIQKLEKINNFKILYITEYGSKLYGTDNEKSDTDYKGIFVSPLDDVLLKKDKEHYTSKATKVKNTKDDVDIQLFSLHKFFELLKKGETGALDLLFSMFSPSIVYKDELFVETIKMYHKQFLNKKIHSFTGYAVGQAKKYGIKGTRYKELQDFKKHFEILNLTDTLDTIFPEFREYFKINNTKYLKMIQAPGPKTGTGDIEYVEILGKKFSGAVSISYFLDRIHQINFGHRVKEASKGVDYKALSHSVRVLFEVEELLDTGFITFPLKEKETVKNVKENKTPLKETMKFINFKLDEVKNKLDESKLPEKSNVERMEEVELYFLKIYGKI